MARNLLTGLSGIDLVYSVSQNQTVRLVLRLSRIPQLLVESALRLTCECSKWCDSPELCSYGCRVLFIRASLNTNPLSVQVPQRLPHLHLPAYKNPTLLQVNMKVSLKISDLEHRSMFFALIIFPR